MNWPLAIARNRTALLAVVATIIALLGGREAATGPIARRLRNAALALLRPAESAARRLIVISARGLKAPPPRSAPVFSLPVFSGPDLAGAPRPGQEGGPSGLSRLRAFRLFDRRKRFLLKVKAPKPAGVPRIRTFSSAATSWSSAAATSWSSAAAPWPSAAATTPPPAARPDPDALVDLGSLRLRLGALERALADLPHQARRLARWRARERTRREVRPGISVHQPLRPVLRPGRPPGWRARPGREVDLVLRECHALALQALTVPALQPDTS
jgi:hypothetical protein